MNPEANYIDVAVLQESLDPEIRPWRLGATMFTLCGVLALLVAAVGMYSVMSYVVAQRSHEFAVRSALGAQPADIARLIVSGGVGMAALGVAVGLVPAWIGGTWIQPMLFETSGRDPVVYVAVAATLLGVAALACVVPAVRARRVAPAAALRAE
jgi:ABC-type antimicrobial peptide transport system permease subunit